MKNTFETFDIDLHTEIIAVICIIIDYFILTTYS